MLNKTHFENGNAVVSVVYIFIKVNALDCITIFLHIRYTQLYSDDR